MEVKRRRENRAERLIESRFDENIEKKALKREGGESIASPPLMYTLTIILVLLKHHIHTNRWKSYTFPLYPIFRAEHLT